MSAMLGKGVNPGSLRPYQFDRANEALGILQGGESCLLTMATGLGKTRTAAEIVKNTPGRVLWIAHRIELVRQAAQELSRVCQEVIGWETSEPKQTSTIERIVVASKDTVRVPQRLERLRQQSWSLLVIDEAHHKAAVSYQSICNALNCPVLGLTATPGRSDKAGLGFARHTAPMSVVDGIDGGWLVPPVVWRAKVKSVDLSGVSTIAGDFAPGELDAVMRAEQSVHGVAEAAMRKAGTRPTLIYCTSLDAAERTCEVLLRNGAAARFVHGETPADERKVMFRDFGRTYQFLCNVAIATEGTDLPDAGCIVLARPTKSRTLFAQILGRGLRTLPGVDAYTTASERCAWIAGGSKPACLLVDVVGTAGRHRLATADDLLGDILGATETVRQRVAKQGDAGGEIDVLSALRAEQAREAQQIAARDARRKAAVASRDGIRATVDLELIRAQFGQDIPDLSTGDPPTLRQIGQMVEYQLVPIPKGLTFRLAEEMIRQAEIRRDVASDKQILLLKRFGRYREGMGRKECSRVLNLCMAKSQHPWRRPKQFANRS